MRSTHDRPANNANTSKPPRTTARRLPKPPTCCCCCCCCFWCDCTVLPRGACSGDTRHRVWRYSSTTIVNGRRRISATWAYYHWRRLWCSSLNLSWSLSVRSWLPTIDYCSSRRDWWYCLSVRQNITVVVAVVIATLKANQQRHCSALEDTGRCFVLTRAAQRLANYFDWHDALEEHAAMTANLLLMIR